MSDVINPRVDIAFKKIFGVEENKDLLISLINSIVDEEDRVDDVTLLNPYNPKNFRNDKLSILDIKAKSKTGKRYNIEIQIADEADYDKRALYYWAKLYTEQLQQKEDYGLLNKAIGIHILNFTSILDSNKYHNVFHIKERDSNIPYYHDLQLHTIELKKFSPNYQAELPELLMKIKDMLDLWIAFLTRHDLLNKDALPKNLDIPELKKALHVLEVMNFNPEERDLYEDHLKWLRIEANTVKKYEEKGFEKGLEKGLEKGEKIGMKKGEQIGLKKGKEQGKAEGKAEGKREQALATAKVLLSQGIDVAVITQATGLSKQEIESL